MLIAAAPKRRRRWWSISSCIFFSRRFVIALCDSLSGRNLHGCEFPEESRSLGHDPLHDLTSRRDIVHEADGLADRHICGLEVAGRRGFPDFLELIGSRSCEVGFMAMPLAHESVLDDPARIARRP